MQLIADRFAVDDRGHAIDLATGDPVCLLQSTAGGPSEQARWAERCAWFASVVHPSLAQLVDYGGLGETKRFEAWDAQPGWHGARAAAEQSLSRAARFLAAHGRAPLANGVAAACRSGRPVAVPDAAAGLAVQDAGEGIGEGSKELIGIIRQPDRRLAPLVEIFAGQTSGRVVAMAVWAPEGGGIRGAVLTLARVARLGGCVPVATPMFDRTVRELVRGRTLVLLAGEDVEGGWRSVLDASLDAAKPHLLLFAGSQAARRVHTVSLERWSVDALIASVSLSGMARRHLRIVSTAARRSQGLRERFEQLLFGAAGQEWNAERPHLSRPRRAPHLRASVAEDELGTARVVESPRACAGASCGERARQDSDEQTRSWPAPGELPRLRRQVETARARLANGRYQPGERGMRQAMHAFARRGEWAPASDCAVLLARSLLKRGRLPDADGVLKTAQPWTTRSRDLRLLQDLTMLSAEVRTESGRLAEAESLLEPVLASAISSGAGGTVDATLALARCLYWQGRYADAWQRLALVRPEAEAVPRDAIRLWTARSRISVGRGRMADAVADSARARDAACAMNDAALSGPALYASALALLTAGDASQADLAAAGALDCARRVHDPLLALCARTLRAEICRRQGQRGPAMLLVRRMAEVGKGVLPATVRARIDLLRDLLSAVDSTDVGEHRAEVSGLPAIRLFAPQRPPASSFAPSTDDIVELLRCCQVADEDNAVLAAVCARLRGRLQAAAVAFFALDPGGPISVAGDGARIDAASARRVHAANQLVLPHQGGERVEAGVPVRYAGQVVGLLIATWTPAAVCHAGDVSILLSTGATAAAPALSGLLARREGARVSRASELLGVSGAIAGVRAAVERAASAPFSVLVEGESGSGKELVARLLHKLGSRRDRPFCTLNCAALPEDLVESELFGHARGAFTGAVGERRGVFEDAHSGTLFLDEIGELSPRAQAKLLRVIQEGEIRRVGENICRRVDVRLVTATNRDLRVEGASGRFRLDLLYRLDVIRIALPPLRERRDDITVLAGYFWREASGRVGSRATLSVATLAALARYDWPGNIRELQNVLAALVVRSPKRGVVPPTALPSHFGAPDPVEASSLDSARRTFDRSFIRAALVRAGGHRSRAAEELGVSRQGLAKLIARLEIGDDVTSSA